MSFEPGTRVGRYEIRALLGAGGMGEVYRAVDTELHRQVALKFLPPEVAADERRMSRFVQEARAASALNHPNIIAVYEIGEASGARFFATEFVEGATLREHMAAGRMSVRDVLDVGLQIASALVKAHSAGIVHRDIKPENVMLTHDGYVKVLDFGLAKFTETSARSVDSEAATRALVNTDPGSVMGTVSYMSPEQARGQEVDARTDIWSLGVVLYEMLSGQLPFAPGEGATPSHVIVAILEKEPLPLAHLAPEVPPDLAHVVSDALTKDRDERFQTARQMLASLKKVKQRLDAGAELERSVAPERLAAAATVSNPSGGWRPTAPEARRSTARSGEVAADLHTTSSAEYVFNQMRSHKRGLFVALALVAVLAAGLGYGVY
ncbi:MAG TPA: serine/threonine-protein kinase, partial [Pyrinomonadaceae bacterium]|nr:serine/threonine-protein kinase [Pyrinomonadaceae bacterium]